MVDFEKIEVEVQKIANHFGPDKIILFGSFAWGIPGPDSDVDLLIVKETEDTRKLAREMDGFLFPRPFPIDLIVFNPDQVEQRRQMGDFFMEDILNRGKVLYDRKTQRTI